MLLLSLACAVFAGLMIAVIVLWQRRARGEGGTLAHDKALYAAFVADIERREAAGDLSADLAQEERAEAGRALLKASDGAVGVAPVPRAWLAGGASAIAVAGMGLYLFIGHPTLPDQPYKQRLKAWGLMAASDPRSLPVPAMVAVLRRDRDRPDNTAEYWSALGRAEMLSGNSYDGLKAYRKALALTGPEAFSDWSALGEAMTVRAGVVTPEARQAFDAALRFEPKDARAHYYLGKQAVLDGQFAEARSHFMTALANVPPGDDSHLQLTEELAAVGPTEAADTAAKVRISGMVASLAESLKADPKNADGWARLLRSYDVLGDAAAHDKAVAQMQAAFPAAEAAAILAKSRAAVGAENTGGM